MRRLEATRDSEHMAARHQDSGMKKALRVCLGMAAYGAASAVHAQQIVPAIEWDRFYGNSACEFSSVVEKADGGYTLGGKLYRWADKEWFDDCALVKIGSQGELKWEKIYGGTGSESVTSLRQTPDGGYIFAATSTSPRSGNKQAPYGGGKDLWVVKVDAAGNKQWERSWQGSADEAAVSIWLAPHGGYEVAGTSDAVQNYWVLQIDAQGGWGANTSLGGKTLPPGVSLRQTTDGGYILAGGWFTPPADGESSPAFGDSDGWAMKVDAEGKKQWERLFGGTRNEAFGSVDQSADGGFILGGRTGPPFSDHFPGFDHWIAKVDASGQKEWERSFGTDAFNEEIRVVRQTTDGGYILGGISGLIKIDAKGNPEWEILIGDVRRYGLELNDLIQTRDGGYLVCGKDSTGIELGASCLSVSWVAKVEPLVSRAGEVVTWKSAAGTALESVNDLNGDWKTDPSEVLSLGDANAIALLLAGQQRYYRLRSTDTSNEPPTLSFGALLSWPVDLNQALESSMTKDGPWQEFSGDQGVVGNTRYAIVPEDLRQHYFRTRKRE